MDKTNILFLSPLPPPYYGSAMSSQTCLSVLQSSQKYNVTNIKVNYSESFSDIEKISFKKIAGYFITLYRIIHYSNRYKPHLVYLMPATTGFGFVRDFSFALLLKMFHHNIVFHLRTQITERQRKHRIKNYILKKVFNNSKVIVLGKELRKGILSYFHSSDIYILPNAIKGTLKEKNFKKIEDSRQPTGKLRLIFISNMMKTKGWDKTLLAAGILKQQNYDFVLHFAGSWPSKKTQKEFSSMVEELGLNENIIYLGHIDNKQKKEILSNSDVMVFPTAYKNEALPRVIIEAYEYGIPVISTKNGSIPSMILHEQTGYLLEENTPEQIAEFLVTLYDKKKLTEMGRKARERFLSNYELSVFSRNFRRIIDEILSISEKKSQSN